MPNKNNDDITDVVFDDADTDRLKKAVDASDIRGKIVKKVGSSGRGGYREGVGRGPEFWHAVESDYRMATLTVREIAKKHGVSETSINKKAKTLGWKRDLKKRVDERADQIIREREQAARDRAEQTESAKSEAIALRDQSRATPGGILIDDEMLEFSARAVAAMKLSHRQTISRYRALSDQLLEELEGQTVMKEELQQLAELMEENSEDARDKMSQIFKKVIDTPSRVNSFRQLSDTLKTMISLERNAYGVFDKNEERLVGESIAISNVDEMSDEELMRILGPSPSGE